MAETINAKRGHRFKDISGQRFGRLTVLEFSHIQDGRAFWRCLCDCGTNAIVNGRNLRQRLTMSCGCIRTENVTERNTTHGMTFTSEFSCWTAIISRCTNPKNSHFKYYGGRGIAVCQRWLDSFENFFEDMGPNPSPKHTIDRKDNDGPYCKENCRWATRKEQGQNKRNNVKITFRGKTQCASAWSMELGISRKTVVRRHRNGVSLTQ